MLPNTKGAGLLVATQAQRAEGYKNYTTKLAPLPGLVGFHWFQWSDQPAEGRGSDGENSNFGLVNKAGTLTATRCAACNTPRSMISQCPLVGL